MSVKNIFWVLVCILILFFIYQNTNATFSRLNLSYFLLSALMFLCSTVFWAFAWIFLMGKPVLKLLKINFKSLLGIFAPFGLGGDVLRTYFVRKEKIKPEKALSASFIVKFYKFLLMFVFLLIAIYLLVPRTVDFPQNMFAFISIIFFTLFGAFLILLFRIEKAANFLFKHFKKIFILRFRRELDKSFLKIKARQAVVLILLLLISTFFEIAAVFFGFLSVGQELLLTHIFIFSALAHSLALITVTPQGIGFVEAGGFFVLSLGYFSLSKQVIGSFLIVWNLVRIWIPSLIGLITTWRFK